uniref:Flagellar protein FliT n=1 Tax=Fervidobacterium thailandense TaxID=1008305 RepID=A0A7C4RWW5_9BACT
MVMFNDEPKDIIEIETLIDKAIEKEDYEVLNQLLDLREKLLPELPQETLIEIYERDRVRMELLKKKLRDFEKLTQQLETGKRFASSQVQDEKGTFLNRDV